MRGPEKKYIQPVFFVNERYWPDASERIEAIQLMTQELGRQLDGKISASLVISSARDAEQFEKDTRKKYALFIAMSGGVQPWMLHVADKVSAVGILPAYTVSLAPAETTRLLLERNASPASFETFCVLQNNQQTVFWLQNKVQLVRFCKAANAILQIQDSRILLVGGTESWVVSSTRDLALFKERFGLDIMKIELEELFENFNRVSEAEAQPMTEKWIDKADALIEPLRADVVRAGRLIIAFQRLLDQYNADGVAIACFTMLEKLHTTSCLALSFLNDSPNYIGACEGDLDSAVTLMLVKAVTQQPGWMANPNVNENGSIDLVHCTAPLHLGRADSTYSLRTHHESGIGVSPEVALPVNQDVTLCRIGKNLTALSVTHGISQSTPSMPTCRTQLRIKVKSLENFLDHALGNHQTLVFGDHVQELSYCGKLLGLDVLKSVF